MARNITVTFDDGSTHTYANAPDDVTPDAVQTRAEKEFGKTVTHLDGGKGAAPAVTAPAVAPSGEGMPAGPRSAGLFDRLTASPQRVTPADILRAKQEEEVGAPGITPGVNPRAVAYPMLQMAGAAAGGAIGGIPGAAVGYAIPTQLERYTGENAPKTLKEAGVAAAEDVATGAAAEVGGRLVGKAVGAAVKKLAPSTAQTVEQLKAESNALRNKMYKTGQEFDPNQLRASVNEGISGISPEYPIGAEAQSSVAPKTQSALKEIDSLIEAHSQGKPIKIDQLEHVNTMLNDAIRAGGRDSVYATAAKSKLNEFANTFGGEAGDLWRQARDLEVRQFRSQEVKDMADAASSKDIRKQFQDLLDSNKIRTYTSEQQQLIQQIANGSATEKGLEMVSKLAPKSFGWGKIAGLLGFSHLVGGTPLTVGTLTAYGTGAAARATANALARSRVNALDELIRGGQLAPPVDLSFLRPAATAGTIFATQPSQNALAPQQ